MDASAHLAVIYLDPGHLRVKDGINVELIRARTRHHPLLVDDQGRATR